MSNNKKEPQEKTLQEEIVDVCLRRGIVFPTAEIYGGAAGFYEYGPVGTMIKHNIVNLFRETFINSEDNVYEISGSTVMPENVFKASGHVKSFHDPLTQCNKCKSMHRADHLIDASLGLNAEGKSNDELFAIISENALKCPTCKKGDLDPPREFNMMLKTNIGPVEGNTAYLRPETAQNIFINFRRIAHSMRAKLPFGIAQIGKAYRNEISPRNFLVRLREFEQMELEMFVNPDELDNHPRFEEIADVEIQFLSQEAQEKGEEPSKITIKEGVEKNQIYNQYLGYYMAIESLFLQNLGIPEEKFRFRHLMPKETAHYSKANYDLEIIFPFGIVECIGLAYRTDYDLLKHQEISGMKMHIDVEGKKVIPHVIEPSLGISRLLYAVLLNSYIKEGRKWTWFKFSNSLAPWVVLVTPLQRKDGLPEEANNLFWEIKDYGIEAIYDQTGAIGKRYARNDEIGVPYTLTIDYDTLENSSVTIRDRNTTEQVRIPMEVAPDIISDLVAMIITWEELKDKYETK